MKRVLKIFGFSIVLLLFGAGFGWGLHTLLGEPAEEVVTEQPVYTRAENGEVSNVFTVNVAAEWSGSDGLINRAQGVLTSLDTDPSKNLTAGQTLYTVNGEAVKVARGTVPMYRTIAEKSVGEDVKQLQQMLIDTGYLYYNADGVAGPRTVAAIKRFQKANGWEETGEIPEGRIIFAPDLPGRFGFSEDFGVGATLEGGEKLVQTYGHAPVFSLEIDPEQASNFPSGLRVVLNFEDHVWEGVLGEQTIDEEGTTTIAVTGQGDNSLCEQNCGVIPVQGRTLIPADVISTEPVSGIRIPASAVGTSSDGQQRVTDETGKDHEVTVIAGARGMVIVEGIGEGTMVKTPYGDSLDPATVSDASENGE